MITQNLTSQPTFFGCNATDGTPLVLYLPNSPWSGYSNFSYMQSSFTDKQLNATVENAFQLATYGNGQYDEECPACLACATIKGSLERTGVDLPNQCTQCFARHCWNGTESNEDVTDADLDLRPRLDPTLTYKDWYDNVWEGKQSNDSTSNGTGGMGNPTNGTTGDTAGNTTGGPTEETPTDTASVTLGGSSLALTCIALTVLFLL